MANTAESPQIAWPGDDAHPRPLADDSDDDALADPDEAAIYGCEYVTVAGHVPAPARRNPLPLVLAALVLLGGGIFAGWKLLTPTSGPGTAPGPVAIASSPSGASPSSPSASSTSAAPSASVDPREAAAVIDTLLSRSAAQRSLLSSAVSCSTAAETAVNDLQTIIDGRSALLDEVGRASFTGLPNAEKLKKDLVSAWTHSKSADEHFLAWAQSRAVIGGGCRQRGDDWSSGVEDSTKARAYKRAFAAGWKAVAKKYSLSERTSLDI